VDRYPVLLNLLPITSGGGQQVVLTFLKEITLNSGAIRFIVLAKKNTEIEAYLKSQNVLDYFISGEGVISRLYFEFVEMGRIIKQTNALIVYTFFGALLSRPSVKIISGCAYSNLFYPEIDFWRVGLVARIKKNIIDRVRFQSYRKADLVIFENTALQAKAEKEFDFPNTITLLPSISVKSHDVSTAGESQVASVDTDKFNFILLTGFHVNKNIDLLIDVAVKLQDLNRDDVLFNLSINPLDKKAAAFIEKINSLKIQGYFNFMGRVAASDVEFIVGACDAVMLLSTLESFSNNLIEAWAYERPLIITDADWSRAACQDAALFVDISKVDSIVKAIISLNNDKDLYAKLVRHGERRLLDFPKPSEKASLHVKLLESYCNHD